MASLPQIRPEQEGLGHPTVMDPALAMEHGVPYVHLVVFAIDVDRVRAAVEEREDQAADPPESTWPFGWEVFLTEMYLLGALDPADPAHRAMLADTCALIHEMGPFEQPPFGAQIPFAVYDAVARGAWPGDLAGELLGFWKKPPKALVRQLAPLWEDPEADARDLALECLELDLTPPLAPPTRAALEAMVDVY